MFGNDRYGDCTCTAAAHMVQNWTTNADKAFTPTEASVVKFYEHFVGTPPADEGVYLIDALKYWRSHGLDRHKILAFTELELQNQVQAQDAVYMFGSISSESPCPILRLWATWPATPWTVPSKGAVGDAEPNPSNGHCIPAVAYDARNLYVVTWGEVKSMSWQFYASYADEVYAVLSKDFVDKNGSREWLRSRIPRKRSRRVAARAEHGCGEFSRAHVPAPA